MEAPGRQLARAQLAKLLREPLHRLADEAPLSGLERWDASLVRPLLRHAGRHLGEEQLRGLVRVRDLLDLLTDEPRGTRAAGWQTAVASALAPRLAPESGGTRLEAGLRAAAGGSGGAEAGGSAAAAGSHPGAAPPSPALQPVPVPPAPEGAFTSTLPYESERIGAAALCCSDGRLGEATDEFLHQHLELPRYDRLSCPGGPVALAGRLLAQWECRGVEEQLRLLVRLHGLRRVVLIAHDDCGYYRERLGIRPAQAEAEQRKDLERAASAVRRIDAGLEADAFYARRDGGRVRFDPVPLSRDGS